VHSAAGAALDAGEGVDAEELREGEGLREPPFRVGGEGEQREPIVVVPGGHGVRRVRGQSAALQLIMSSPWTARTVVLTFPGPVTGDGRVADGLVRALPARVLRAAATGDRPGDVDQRLALLTTGSVSMRWRRVVFLPC